MPSLAGPGGLGYDVAIRRLALLAAGLGLADAVRLGLPRADGRLTLTLEAAATRFAVEAWMEQRARMTLDGRIGAPAWSPTAPLALNGRGSIDRALLAAWLGAEGRRAEGRVDPPRLDGRLGLADGAWSDRRLGLLLDGIRGDAVAILVVEGRARAPRVELRGEPPMPDDEVLSRLLFGVPPARLSGLQLTRLGLAAASIAGIGADGNGLLSRVRTGLGLERLRIDSDRRGGTVLEGGLDLGERVSIGGRQGLERGDPRAVLGLQLAPRIRFESDVGARGAGAGAAFELEY
jgi:hypothetical protein